MLSCPQKPSSSFQGPPGVEGPEGSTGHAGMKGQKVSGSISSR